MVLAAGAGLVGAIVGTVASVVCLIEEEEQSLSAGHSMKAVHVGIDWVVRTRISGNHNADGIDVLDTGRVDGGSQGMAGHAESKGRDDGGLEKHFC